MEQENNDAQGDQTDKPIFTQTFDQSGEIGNNSSKKGNCAAKKDLDYNPKGNQQ